MSTRRSKSSQKGRRPRPSLPPDLDLDRVLSVAERLARQAGDVLLSHLGRLTAGQIHKKSEIDLVTIADRASQDVIVKGLEAAFPTHIVLAEESDVQEAASGIGHEYVWHVDPLDGTTNFVHGFPYFSVSIALFRTVPKRRPEPLVAVVHAPALAETFEARRGGGARLGARAIYVSRTVTLADALLCTGFACVRDRIEHDNIAAFTSLMHRTQGVRRTGSAALDLAYVAAGRYEGFWELQLASWDVAAGALLVQEAGGSVTDMQGGDGWLDGKSICATNGRVHRALLAELAATRSVRTAEPTVADLARRMRAFVAQRSWDRFHIPKNLAMSVAIEAAELMEIFQWLDADQADAVSRDPKMLAHASDEMADVLAYLLGLANRLGVDLASAFARKMDANALRYPADAFRGKSGSPEPQKPVAAGSPGAPQAGPARRRSTSPRRHR